MKIYLIKTERESATGYFADRALIAPTLQLWYGLPFEVHDVSGLFMVVNKTDKTDYHVFHVEEIEVRETVSKF